MIVSLHRQSSSVEGLTLIRPARFAPLPEEPEPEEPVDLLEDIFGLFLVRDAELTG